MEIRFLQPTNKVDGIVHERFFAPGINLSKVLSDVRLATNTCDTTFESLCCEKLFGLSFCQKTTTMPVRDFSADFW